MRCKTRLRGGWYSTRVRQGPRLVAPHDIPSSSSHSRRSSPTRAARYSVQRCWVLGRTFLHRSLGPHCLPPPTRCPCSCQMGQSQCGSPYLSSQSPPPRPTWKFGTATTRAWMAPKNVAQVASGASTRPSVEGGAGEQASRRAGEGDIFSSPDITAHGSHGCVFVLKFRTIKVDVTWEERALPMLRTAVPLPISYIHVLLFDPYSCWTVSSGPFLKILFHPESPSRLSSLKETV